jgi:hypothetical protein
MSTPRGSRASALLGLAPLLAGVGAVSLGAQPVTKSPAPSRGPGASYHVLREVRLGGAGGWDYLTPDSAAHRVFVTRGTHVMVVDTRTDSVVGDLPDTPGVHGVAVVRELGRGYTSNGRDSTIGVFDLTTLAPVARIKERGANPDAITYDAATRRIFAFNGRTADAVVIDAAADTVVGMIPLGGKPETGVTDGKGMLWVNVEDKSELAVVDTRTLAVKAHWALAPCEEPTGLALDRAARRLFVACGNRTMAVVNADDGRIVTTLPIGDGADAAAFDPGTGLAFASGGDGTITVIRATARDKYAVVQTIATKRGARTMTVEPTTHRLYTVSAEYDTAPAPTATNPRPRPPMKLDSFTLIVVAP